MAEEGGQSPINTGTQSGTQTFEHDPDKDDDCFTGPDMGTDMITADDDFSAPNLAMETFAGKTYSRVADEAGADQVYMVSSEEGDEKTAKGKFVNLHAAKQAFESPLERLARLRREVEEFTADLALLDKANAMTALSSKSPDNVHVVQLTRDMNAATIHAPSAPALSPSCQDAWHGTARTAGQQLAASLKNSGQGLPANLQLKLPFGIDAQASDVAEWDARISSLESSVGKASQQGDDLLTRLNALRTKLQLFDDNKLATVSRAISVVALDLQIATQSSASVTSTKLDELSKLMDTAQPNVEAVAQVQAALVKSREEDERAANLLLRLHRVELASAACSEMVRADQSCLTQAAKGLQANMALLGTNAESLESRMVKLVGAIENGGRTKPTRMAARMADGKGGRKLSELSSNIFAHELARLNSESG